MKKEKSLPSKSEVKEAVKPKDKVKVIKLIDLVIKIKDPDVIDMSSFAVEAVKMIYNENKVIGIVEYKGDTLFVCEA